MPIVCVGEGLEDRKQGRYLETVASQVSSLFCGLSEDEAAKVTVAYEPIWAIGTGLTATPDQAEEMCGFIRAIIAGICGGDTAACVSIQYGGSVKPSNIAGLMAQPDIDGALVGGASLDAESFAKIVNY